MTRCRREIGNWKLEIGEKRIKAEAQELRGEKKSVELDELDRKSPPLETKGGAPSRSVIQWR